MRYLGIDYGHKRIGLSYADEVGVAVPLAALVTGNAEEKMQQLVAIAAERKIEALVVGYPYNMDGSSGDKAHEVEAFVAHLQKYLPLPVHYTDERLTTYQASSDSVLKKKKKRGLAATRAHRNSGVLDSQAATLILQDFIGLI